MRRPLATLAALGFTWLALPAVPAYACSVPGPWFEVSREAVAAGDPIGVSGHASSVRCPEFTMPPSETPSESATQGETATPTETAAPSETPSETVSETPSETPSETVSETPSETVAPSASATETTAPPPAPDGDSGEQAFRPEAAMRLAQVPGRVVISLIAEDDARDPLAPRQVIGTVPEERTTSGSGTTRTFDGTVTVPASTTPGRYVVDASSDIHYGRRPLVVGASLPATGAHTTSMLKVALMFGTSGVLAVAGGVAMARRRA